MRILFLILILAIFGCSTPSEPEDGPGGQYPLPSENSTISTVEVQPLNSEVLVTSTLQLNAAAKDQKGKVMSGRTFAWSTEAQLLAEISSSGVLKARSAGDVKVSVTDQASGKSAHAVVKLKAPNRPSGSLLGIGSESTSQFGEPIGMSTVGYIDTSRTGKDYRAGIVHVSMEAQFMNPPISRAEFPQISAITECQNGKVYAASYTSNQGQNPADIWEVSLTTAVISQSMRDPFGTSTTVTGMACNNDNLLYIVVEHLVGMRYLYLANPRTGQVGLMQSYNSAYPVSVSIAGSGTMYATVQEFGKTGQKLATMDPQTGKLTPIGSNQAYSLPLVKGLIFRGDRLFGHTASKLVRMNTETGSVSEIRAYNIP